MAHREIWKDASGIKRPSVTTVRSILDQPALRKYYAFQGWSACIKTLGGFALERVPQFLVADPRVTWEGHKGWERSQSHGVKAADLGTEVHNILDAYLDNKPAPAGSSDAAVMLANELQAWYRRHKMTTVLSEKHLGDEVNLYHGTLDRLVRLGRSLVLLDWKTSKAIYPEYLYQLGGYMQLLQANGVIEGPIAGAIIRIDKETCKVEKKGFSVDEMVRGRDTFLAIRKVYSLVKGS